MSQLELKLSSGVQVNEILSFHNTINLSDDEVKAADAVCKTQEDRIMAIFHTHKKPPDFTRVSHFRALMDLMRCFSIATNGRVLPKVGHYTTNV